MEMEMDYDLTACLEYNPQEGYTVDDIAEVLAVWEGQNDGDFWRWILRLNDGRFVFLDGGCDYTGWDCQSEATSVFAATAIEVLALGIKDQMDRQDVHTHLLVQLKTAVAQTWRQAKDKEMGHPPFVDF